MFWDGKTKVEIVIDTDYKNTTCGLCGDYDGVMENDWTVGPQCPESIELPGQVVSTLRMYVCLSVCVCMHAHTHTHTHTQGYLMLS